MKEIFFISPHDTHRRNEIFVQSQKKKKKNYGNESLRALFLPLWNILSEKNKSTN